MMANATFPRASQDDDPTTVRNALRAFLERLDSSAALEELRNDGGVTHDDLAHIVWAMVTTVANKLHQDSLAKDPEEVDRISRDVPTERLEQAAATLRAAESLLREPIEGVSFGHYLLDEDAAASAGRIAELYEFAIGYRKHRENERRLRTPGQTGASRSPETDLLEILDTVLSGRAAKERRSYGIALARDLIDVVLTDEQVRLRLKDLKRRSR